MDRKEFFKKSMGVFSILPILIACSEDTAIDTDGSGSQTETGSTNGSSSSNCTVTKTETEGPYPIKSPSSVVYSNIVGDRQGVLMTMELTIKNANNSCQALENVFVDAWQCDALGNYSQYGSYTAVNWLRGRQSTNAAGIAAFSSIFPGWYQGRAPHIHIHIYNSAGKSLLVTQIAFPKTICDNVYTNASPYKSKGLQDTTNESDGIFRDGFADQMATLSGSISEGYTLTHTIVVNG